MGVGCWVGRGTPYGSRVDFGGTETCWWEGSPVEGSEWRWWGGWRRRPEVVFASIITVMDIENNVDCCSCLFGVNVLLLCGVVALLCGRPSVIADWASMVGNESRRWLIIVPSGSFNCFLALLSSSRWSTGRGEERRWWPAEAFAVCFGNAFLLRGDQSMHRHRQRTGTQRQRPTASRPFHRFKWRCSVTTELRRSMDNTDVTGPFSCHHFLEWKQSNSTALRPQHPEPLSSTSPVDSESRKPIFLQPA